MKWVKFLVNSQEKQGEEYLKLYIFCLSVRFQCDLFNYFDISRLKVSKLQSFCFNYNEISELFPLLGVETEESLVKFWTSGMSVGVELMGTDCLRVVRSLAEQMNSTSRTPVVIDI